MLVLLDYSFPSQKDHISYKIHMHTDNKIRIYSVVFFIIILKYDDYAKCKEGSTCLA